MHLGQTATFLAEVINRPEPTVRMVSRILREAGWIRKGPRGVNAPHLTADELVSFVLALMCAPDSPAIGLDRLAHFRGLVLDDDAGSGRTLAEGLAVLFTRIAAEGAVDARERNWRVIIAIDSSMAAITEDHGPDDDGETKTVRHNFSSLVTATDDTLIRDAFPYYSGLEFTSSLSCWTLFRIAKVVLADEPDPLNELVAMQSG